MLRNEAVRSGKIGSESRVKNLFDIDEGTFESIRVSFGVIAMNVIYS